MSVAFSSSPLLVSSSSSCSTAASSSQSRSQWAQPDLHCELQIPAGPQPRPSPPVFPAGPQPRPSPPVEVRQGTLGGDGRGLRSGREHWAWMVVVFPAGPQPRPSPPSVPCRTSTTTIHAQCSLPDLNHEYPRQKICHIECQKICQIEC